MEKQKNKTTRKLKLTLNRGHWSRISLAGQMNHMSASQVASYLVSEGKDIVDLSNHNYRLKSRRKNS